MPKLRIQWRGARLHPLTRVNSHPVIVRLPEMLTQPDEVTGRLKPFVRSAR